MLITPHAAGSILHTDLVRRGAPPSVQQQQDRAGRDATPNAGLPVASAPPRGGPPSCRITHARPAGEATLVCTANEQGRTTHPSLHCPHIYTSPTRQNAPASLSDQMHPHPYVATLFPGRGRLLEFPEESRPHEP